MRAYSITSKMPTVTKAGLLAASFGLMAATSAFGGVCSDYAADAVAANKRAVAMGCGFGPPVWSSSYQSHQKWCAHGANAAKAPAETAKRASALQKCQVSFCRTYALEAVDANHKAAALGCGFKPPVWSNNHQKHYDWCMHGDNPLRAGQETKARATKLANCKAGQPAPNAGPNIACDLYANEALKLAAKASALHCGFSGPRWVQSYTVHYRFCAAGANPLVLLAEAAARNSQYKACRAGK